MVGCSRCGGRPHMQAPKVSIRGITGLLKCGDLNLGEGGVRESMGAFKAGREVDMIKIHCVQV